MIPMQHFEEMPKEELLAYLREHAKKQLEGCTRLTTSGISILTPDGMGNYDALWARDFAYMAEYAGDLITTERLKEGVEYLLTHPREEDGWFPDRVNIDGTAVYAAGNPWLPCGEANLDNAPFLAISFALLLDRMTNKEAIAFLNEHLAALWKGLAVIPLDAKGLVYNTPEKPHSPYGFTDCICKTGSLMIESVLLWRACRMVAERLHRYAVAPMICAEMEHTAKNIEEALEEIFYDEKTGMFFAATEDCHQIDIWGCAYALSVGFPLSEKAEASTREGLVKYADGILESGQLRHTLPGEFWDKLLLEVPQGEYQNGAYWATATGWYMDAVRPIDEALAKKVLFEAVTYFANVGTFECVNGDYKKLDNFVVSATNVYGAAKTLFA